MISRLLSIIILLVVGIGILLYLFSDDLIKKGEDTATQTKEVIQSNIKEIQSQVETKTEDTIESMMKEMQEVLDKAESSVQESNVLDAK